MTDQLFFHLFFIDLKSMFCVVDFKTFFKKLVRGYTALLQVGGKILTQSSQILNLLSPVVREKNCNIR